MMSMPLYENLCPECAKEVFTQYGLKFDDSNIITDEDALISEIEAQRALMISVATGGPRIEDVNSDYQERRKRLSQLLKQRGLPDPNGFDDLWAWYGKWSSGDLPTFQSRRKYISELYKPILDRLSSIIIKNRYQPINEPTGWARVDRGVDAFITSLEVASVEEEFQTVGLLCRETLISLAQAVYEPEIHAPVDGTTPSKTDAKRMLDGYFAKELKGRSNEAARKHARAALALANELQHRRTATFRDATLCTEATRSVVNIVAIISGKHD